MTLRQTWLTCFSHYFQPLSQDLLCHACRWRRNFASGSFDVNMPMVICGCCGRVGYSAIPMIRTSWVWILAESVIVGKSIPTAPSYQKSKWYTEGSEGIVSWSVLCANEEPDYMLLGELKWNEAQWSGENCAVDRVVSLDIDYNPGPLPLYNGTNFSQ